MWKWLWYNLPWTESTEIQADTNIKRKHRQTSKNFNFKGITFCDSNRKHLDPEKMWKGIKIIPCESYLAFKLDMPELADKNRHQIDGAGLVALTLGAMTSRRKAPKKSSNESLWQLRPLTNWRKIIINEITPRSKYREHEVQSCNKLIRKMLLLFDTTTWEMTDGRLSWANDLLHISLFIFIHYIKL